SKSIPEKYPLEELQNLNANEKKEIIKTALADAAHAASHFYYYVQNIDRQAEDHRKHELERYKRESLAFSCVVMFLVGGPLGAIVRQGGFGMPFVLSLVSFITFYLADTTARQLAKQDALDTWIASWTANGIMICLGILLWLRVLRGPK
ncbi:MAG: LptF/LptG family permease, partial [Cytophagales bacterium]|nr:LptF/LptG family permease [Cytophagales bacterium]